ncbi:unnamed protein product [Penicillium salamii]|uniref:Grh/CP2 DB domain-containing protein n=1 Tax=Penicillium salamii TaxID=1612424 RepID=A0A9W4JFH3_9EURO|nr:unnamed protein product [Penicillium salamii]
MSGTFHSQAGDLHTPTGMHMKNPHHLPNTLNTASQYSHPNGLQPFNPRFAARDMHGSNINMQPAPFAPSSVMHRDTGNDTVENSADGMFLNGMKVETPSNKIQALDLLASPGGETLNPPGEKFRYQVSPRAPTAMIETSSEIPLTYLNKGQPYNIQVVDTTPPPVTDEPIVCRTVIRVSFDEEDQRTDPSASWNLWKEARGLNKSQRPDGKVLAVEYINDTRGAGAQPHHHAQLERNFVDGFSFAWTPKTAAKTPGCDVFVQFNFLSTDFSHSKGVKGVSVRLCAKTELLSPGEGSGVPHSTELSYCKAKLFRDHGAERKQSNDVAHLNKSIGKLNQQVAEAEINGAFAKRRRCNDASDTAQSSDCSTTLSKHGHTSSMDSSSQRVPLKTICDRN